MSGSGCHYQKLLGTPRIESVPPCEYHPRIHCQKKLGMPRIEPGAAWGVQVCYPLCYAAATYVSIIFLNYVHYQKILGMPRIEPGSAGQEQECYPLCYAAATVVYNFS